MSPVEKKSFERAAALFGMTVSGWLRLRLREAAERDLTGRGYPAPYKLPDDGAANE